MTDREMMKKIAIMTVLLYPSAGNLNNDKYREITRYLN
jgi:hypothetical protein